MARYTRRRRSRRGFRKYFSKKVFTYSRKYGGQRWGRKSRRSSRYRTIRRYAPRNFSIGTLRYLLKRKSALRALSRKERSKRKLKRQWHKATFPQGVFWWKRLGKKLLKTDSDAQALASRGQTRYLYKISPPTSKTAPKTTFVSVGDTTGGPKTPSIKVRYLTNDSGQFVSQDAELTVAHFISLTHTAREETAGDDRTMHVADPTPIASTTRRGQRMRLTPIIEEDASSVASGWSVSTVDMGDV